MDSRSTKIICTIGPSTNSFRMLKQLYQAGMDLVRLNMSHASHAESKKIIKWTTIMMALGREKKMMRNFVIFISFFGR